MKKYSISILFFIIGVAFFILPRLLVLILTQMVCWLNRHFSAFRLVIYHSVLHSSQQSIIYYEKNQN